MSSPRFSGWQRVFVVTAAALCLAPNQAQAQWLPAQNRSVSLGFSFGTTELEGSEDSLPPSGRASVWSVRVAVPLSEVISLEGEFTRSGPVDSSSGRVARPLFRERRRDAVTAFYARVDLWRKGFVAVSPVVGVGLVKPTREILVASLNSATGEWTEAPPRGTDFPPYPHTWAMSWGFDVAFSSRHVAIVPEFRAHEHFGDASPWLSARILRTTYGSVGLRYRF